MEVLSEFFGNIKLPKETVPNGSIRWINPNADLLMNRIVHRQYYPLNDFQVKNLESEVNITHHTKVVFPEWYKNFLKKNNGIDIFHGAISLFGFQASIDRSDFDNLQPFSLYRENLARHKKIPKEWLFIGSYSHDGTEIVTDTSKQGSEIFCIYSETDKIFCTWNTFNDFLSNELNRLLQLYNQTSWGVTKKGSRILPNGHKDNK